MSWQTKHAPQEIDGEWWDSECTRIFRELTKIGATTLTISQCEDKKSFRYQLGTVAPGRVESAALFMLEALTNLENDDGAIPPSAWKLVQDAIERAGGTPKGPPGTDIRAEVAALREALAWALATMQDDGDCGNACWNAMKSHEGYQARGILDGTIGKWEEETDTNTTPETRAP